jgi:integrase
MSREISPLGVGFESLPPHFQINPRCEESLDGYQEYLLDKGLRESTIETKTKLIRILRKRVGGLWDSDNVTLYIRRAQWNGRRKNNASYAYRDWCRWKGFDYEFERVKEPDAPLPYIPTERDLDQLIAGMNHKYATFLQLLKESAFRPGETMSLTPRDVDLERRLVTLNTPSKNSRPRQFKMSERLAQMMSERIVSTLRNQRIWPSKYECLHRTFSVRRKALAEKLKNPNLLRISFKTFRHWKATTEYHRTKDILHVMKVLGHKSIHNTLVYTHLIDVKEDEWISKVAHNANEACQLVEAGFEFVCSIQNEEMIFRKRA